MSENKLAVVMLPLIVGVVLSLSGCGDNSGPKSTRTTSAAFSSLDQKQKFLEEYLTFKRTYQDLDFNINYFNGGGISPGPSDWDIRLVAIVPANEISTWIGSHKPTTNPDIGWLKEVPTKIDYSTITEWYRTNRIILGIDRKKNLVAYRIWTN